MTVPDGQLVILALQDQGTGSAGAAAAVRSSLRCGAVLAATAVFFGEIDIAKHPTYRADDR